MIRSHTLPGEILRISHKFLPLFNFEPVDVELFDVVTGPRSVVPVRSAADDSAVFETEIALADHRVTTNLSCTLDVVNLTSVQAGHALTWNP